MTLQTDPLPVQPGETTQTPMTRVRWVVAILLFFATTINYLDRQIFSLLVPKFEGDLRLGPLDLSLINVSFLLCYGCGMVLIGGFIDRVGAKKGLGITFMLWNLASIAHGLVRSLNSFILVRMLLGFGEAGNFPGATRAVAEWFPKKERATAFGIFNSGSNVGFVLAAVLTPFLTEKLGLSWQTCFMVLGGIGILWIFFWLAFFRRPTDQPKANQQEIAHIQSDPVDPQQTFTYPQILGMRPLYGVALAKFFTDAPWWFYLTWLPKFLTDQFHLKPEFMAAALPPIFIFADLGAIGGGWLSSHLIHKGFEVGRARKTAMLVCALCAVPVMFVGLLNPANPVLGVPAIVCAVILMSVAAAAHQGWSSNVYTLLSDTLPKGAVGLAVGIITLFGVVGGAAFQFYVGASVQGGSYAPPFILAGGLYLLGLLVFHLITPRVEPVKPGKPASMVVVALGAVILLAGLGILQYAVSKPPYKDLQAYETQRPLEKKWINAGFTLGPAAKVGWMDAQWIIWKSPGSPELIKFDATGHPYVESKGADAPKYSGPTQAEIDRL